MKLYIGNIDREASEDDLRQAFEVHGQISEVTIIKDRMTGEPRGFAFITFPNDEEAKNAIKAVNGQMLKGRALRVTEALAKEDRPPRREGGGGGGGFRGGEGRSGGGFRGGPREGGPRRSSPRFGQ